MPLRWLAKDLGALLYSAIDCNVTDRDLVAFLRVYLGKGWKKEFNSDAALWRAVVVRAGKFYQRHRSKEMQLPGIFQRFK